MAQVQTVQGPVDAGELGIVLGHEHVRFRDEAVAEQWPGRYDDALELDAALVAVRAAAERGVRTIVDATAMFGGRDVRFMKRVADETGVRIVACTGIYSYDYLPHYFENRDVDVMADHFVEDIERGCQGTDIRAAFLKCAADAAGRHRARREDPPRVRPREPADGRADHGPLDARRRHRPAPGGDLRGGGRRFDRVQIAHCGDTDDVDYIEGLIAKGVYVGLDRYGLEMYLPIDKRNATAAELLRRGHAERLMISQDFCAIDRLVPARGRRGVRKPGGDPQLVDDAGLRRGRAGAARDGRDGRRGVRHDLRREPEALAGRRVAASLRRRHQQLRPFRHVVPHLVDGRVRRMRGQPCFRQRPAQRERFLGSN